MYDFQEIEKVIKDDDLTKYKDYKDYQEKIKTNFEKLFYYKLFIERKNLALYWWESYIKTKYYLKDLALKDNSIDKVLREVSFYDWLKICVNPQKDVSYDFYFEKNKLNKEDEVKKILFENGKDGKLREIFDSDDWQIRLRTIADWFLKRYDIATARRVYKYIKPPHKTIFDKIRLFILRLFGAVFIGLLPLMVGQETWELPLKLGWTWVIPLSLFFLLFAYGYLTIECYNIIKRKEDARKRAVVVCLWGFVYSFVITFFIVTVLGKHFISPTLRIEGFNFIGMQIFPQIIFLFASLAFLIGIFIQVFWEEKTITEPL